MVQKDGTNISVANFSQRGKLSEISLQSQPSSRITRLVGDATRFLHLAVHRKIPDDKLRSGLIKWVRDGIVINEVKCV